MGFFDGVVFFKEGFEDSFGHGSFGGLFVVSWTWVGTFVRLFYL